MAQVDTGLGWKAEADYLVTSASTLCSWGSFEWINDDFPAVPLPKTGSSALDLATSGVIIASNSSYRLYGGSNTPGAMFLRLMRQSGNYLMPTAYSPVMNAECYLVRQNINTGDFDSVMVLKTNRDRGIYNNIQWYYGGYNSIQLGGDTITLYVSDMWEGTAIANYITSEQSPIQKQISGICVACLCTWITPEGVTQTSPVLISTDENFIKMVTDRHSEYINIQRYDGLTFFMAMFLNLPLIVSNNMIIANLSQFGAAAPSKIFALLASDSFANITVTDSPDPYQEGEGSEEGGADGEDDEEDNVDFTDPPSTSIGATGFLTIFCPNLGQLQSLGNYMWGSFDVDNWRKIIANPMDAILGLHTLPIPAVITGTKAVKVAGIDTTIDMSYTTVRYIRRSLGTCEIPKKWGAYLDYSPYTKISIFLPFIGFKELDADDVMGKTIALQYMVDILTGACVAELKCENTVLYSWSGNCANEVPISGSDWRGAIASAIGIAATVAGTALVTGGATAPMAASMVASVGANSMNLKPTINRSGAISGSAGYMSQKRPYIIRSIPNLVIPADQNKFIGYPSFVTTSLGSLTGYNEIASIHLEGIPATGNELSEIETLLKGGVIF